MNWKERKKFATKNRHGTEAVWHIGNASEYM